MKLSTTGIKPTRISHSQHQDLHGFGSMVAVDGLRGVWGAGIWTAAATQIIAGFSASSHQLVKTVSSVAPVVQ
jgi:hypothetical protein